MRSFIGVVVALCVCAAHAQTPCTVLDPNNARAICNGVTYDFSQIKNVDGTVVFSGLGPNQYTYYLQMVNGGLPTSTGQCTFTAAGLTVGNAAGQYSPSESVCYPLGQVTSQTWSITGSGQGQQITIEYSNGQDNRKATVVLKCDSSATIPQFSAVGEISLKDYEMDLTSCYACPNNCGAPPPPPPPPGPPSPPGPPGPPSPDKDSGSSEGAPVGWILIGVFFGSLFIYFVGGFVFLKYQRGQSGREAVPHVDFWTSLPGLVKDGCMFVVNKIRGRDASGSYGKL